MHLETSPMRHLRMEYGIPLIIRGKPYDVNMTSPHAFVAVANHYFSSVSEKFSSRTEGGLGPHFLIAGSQFGLPLIAEDEIYTRPASAALEDTVSTRAG